MGVDTEGTEAPRDRFSSVETRLARLCERISWIWLGLVAVILGSVVLRYVFAQGRIELEELQWHLHAVGFLAGILACTLHDRHVRVDVFRERTRPRTRAWIELYGILLLQAPFIALVLWSAAPFAIDSFHVAERSSSAGGLPMRWALKAVLVATFGLLAAATTLRLGRVAGELFASPPSHRSGREEPR